MIGGEADMPSSHNGRGDRWRLTIAFFGFRGFSAVLRRLPPGALPSSSATCFPASPVWRGVRASTACCTSNSSRVTRSSLAKAACSAAWKFFFHLRLKLAKAGWQRFGKTFGQIIKSFGVDHVISPHENCRHFSLTGFCGLCVPTVTHENGAKLGYVPSYGLITGKNPMN